MSVEENKAVAQRLVEEGFRKEGLDILDEVLTPNFVNHSGNTETREAYKQMCEAAFVGFPDCQFVIRDIIARGDKVVVRADVSGTHTGEWFGIPPTNKFVTWTYLLIFRFEGSKVTDLWQEYSSLDFHRQIGLAPSWEEMVEKAKGEKE